MDRNEFINRRADKVSLDRSKRQLWNYIQKKTEKKPRWHEGFLNFFQGHKISFVGTLAVVLILLMVSLNFNISPLKPTEVHASFEMTASQEDASGIEASTAFILKASENVSVGAIKESLKVQPEVDFDVKETEEGHYEVLPKEALEPNQIYHFSILSYVEGKPQEFSWAYQVKDTFKITGTLPGDKTGALLDNGIDITFSHENYDFEQLKSYFEISPALEGHFEKHYKTASFIPKDGLKPGMIYTVTIKKGLKLLDSDQALLEDYSFQFFTAQAYESPEGTQFREAYYEMGEHKPIGLTTYSYGAEAEEGNSLKVKIYQFPDVEAYLEVLKKHSEIPNWATSFSYKAPPLDPSTLKLVTEVDAIQDEIEWNEYIYLPTAELEKGYYLFEIQNPQSKSQALVQITNLSSYLDTTQTDTLLWVNDVATSQPVDGATIEIVGREGLGKSGADGLAVFRTPESLRNQVKPEILKITSDDQTLIHRIDPDYYGQGGSGDTKSNYWYSFTMDRPIYKQTDEINFWGFLKPKNERASLDDLSIKLLSNADSVIEEKSIKLGADGTYSGSFKFSQLPVDFYNIKLYQGENLISQEYLTLQNYVKPAYQITVDTDKKAVFAGETMHFEIKSTFFDGTPVPNLDLTYSSLTSGGVVKTDSEGKAELNLVAKPLRTCSKDYECSNVDNFALNVSPKMSEETDIEGVNYVMIFNSKLALKTIPSSKENQAHLEIKSHFVDLKKMEEGNIGALAPLRKVKGELTEITWEKEEKGQYYDFINKKVVKTYDYKQIRKPAGSFELTTDEKGVGQHDFEMNPESYYEVLLSSLDDEGKKTYETVYVYSGMFFGSSHYNIQLLNTAESEYKISGQTALYDEGDEVEAGFSNGSAVLPDHSKGKFLFLQFSNGLQEHALKDTPQYKFEFNKEDLPSVFVSGVWFTGQNYVVAYGSNAAYKKELKRLTIDVQTDKPSYKPGDQVELKVEVKDKNDEPVQAEVNLNLVDEAYYNIIYDALSDPLDDLYAFNDAGEIYSYDSHDNPLALNQAFEGGGCFVSGTQILMADGSRKNIEDVRAGDLILTKKTPFSSEKVAAKVLSTVSHHVADYLIFNENLKVTKEHVLFVNGQFNVAGEVKIGDKFLNKDEQWVQIQSIREVKAPVMVYNFQVENQHTYFANDFYVHNDKGGDGIRNDFEDNALFETVKTNAKGWGKVTFQLPDNITSWRVTAKAIDPKNLQAGMGVGSVPVGLPLFADLIMNQEYSAQDEPMLKLRAYGDALKEGDRVDFKLSSKSLGLEAKDVQGQAFKGSYFPLPKLTLGHHEVLLEANSGSLKDTLQKPLDVVGSRLNKNNLEFIPQVDSQTPLKLAKNGPTELSFVDGGRGLYYSALKALYYNEGDRLDQRLSQLGAQELFQFYFQEQLPPRNNFEPLIYQDSNGGLKLLPYADPDLELTVLTLLMDRHPERFNAKNLKDYLNAIYQNKESNLNEIALSLAGLAALKEPVLTSLKSIQNESTLLFKEKLYLALAFEALGSKEDARQLFQAWVQDYESRPETTDLKALAAVLAAALNDDEATKIWNQALKIQAPDQYLGLYELGYLKNRLKYAESQPVKFQLSKNGKTETVTLENGSSHPTLLLSTDSFKATVLEGQLAAIARYSNQTKASDLKNSENLILKRNYSVQGKEMNQFSEGDIVKIALTVSSQNNKKGSVFRITDILPSGLIPITSAQTYSMFDTEGVQDYPYQIDGQEINFVWYPVLPGRPYTDEFIDSPDVLVAMEEPDDSKAFDATKTFTYLARVVNPGKFYADPAKIEAFKDPAMSSISQEDWVEIGRLE